MQKEPPSLGDICIKSYMHSDNDCRETLWNKNGCLNINGHDSNFLVMLASYTTKNLESGMRETGHLAFRTLCKTPNVDEKKRSTAGAGE